MTSICDEVVLTDVIAKVNKEFYDRMYEHPWMSRYFDGIEQEHIERQQTDFIVGALGGPKRFLGRPPSSAHPHIFVTDELFDLRRDMLVAALDKVGTPAELREGWLRIDESFRKAITMRSVDECEKRFTTDRILAFHKDGRPM